MEDKFPSGKSLQKAIEHGHLEILDFPIKHGGSFHSYVKVYQRVIWCNKQWNHPSLIHGSKITMHIDNDIDIRITIRNIDVDVDIDTDTGIGIGIDTCIGIDIGITLL